MLTDKRKKTIALMVSNYWKQFDIVIENELSIELTLIEYLEGIGLTAEEIEYANHNNNTRR